MIQTSRGWTRHSLLFADWGRSFSISDVSVNGNNVLSSYAGSSFLTEGTGTDQFYLDSRGATQNSYLTVAGFHSTDNVTEWGITAANFIMDWIGDTYGASGYTG